MAVCLDASVLVKVLVQEPDSAAARRLLQALRDSAEAPVVPCLAAFEVTSALYGKLCASLVSLHDVRAGLEVLGDLPLEMMHPPSIHEEAVALAQRLEKVSIYDAHYLALAQHLRCEFWTADEDLFHAVASQLPWVHSLSEMASEPRA